MSLTALAAMFSVIATKAQSDGDYRTATGSPVWSTANNWQKYNASTGAWTTASTTPATTTNTLIRDGHLLSAANGSYTAASLTVGEGDSFMGTATVVDGKVTAVSVDNPGKFLTTPFFTFAGQGNTVVPVASAILKVVGADKIAGGSNYDENTTVTVGVAWAASTVYSVGTQRSNNGNLYTVATAGTSDAAGGPSGTGSGITDGTVSWNYAGPATTATATVSAGVVTAVNIITQGSGYTAAPAITISGAGTGASYLPYLSVVSMNVTNQGAGYTTVPRVLHTYLGIGNSTTSRTMTILGNVTFRKGVSVFSGSSSGVRTQNLIIGGDLSAESQVDFVMYRQANTGNTDVTFNKSGDQAISGAKMIFNNLTVNAGSSLTVNNEIVVLGTLTNNGTIINNGIIAAPVTTGTGTFGGNVVLGVKLSTFSAKAGSHGVDVHWATSSEENSSRFVLERSSNGVDFTFVREVKSKGASSYIVTDNSPAAGTNYYRLVQYDLNGTSTIYGPVSAKSSLVLSSSLNVYPNPTSGSINFSTQGFYGKVNVVLTDSQGRIVYQEAIPGISSETHKITPKQALASGCYLLQVSGNSGKRTSQVIIL